MFGGKKEYGKHVIEPFQTLADNNKADLELGWVPTGNLPSWIKTYKEKLKL